MANEVIGMDSRQGSQAGPVELMNERNGQAPMSNDRPPISPDGLKRQVPRLFLSWSGPVLPRWARILLETVLAILAAGALLLAARYCMPR